MINSSNTVVLPNSRFPYRLHQMLQEASQTGREDLIVWLPCGTKFRIPKQTEFADIILTKFCRRPQYKSFLRSLSMYKFQRIRSGPNKGCYFHPHFQKDRLDLVEYINRERIEEVPACKLAKPERVPVQKQTRRFTFDSLKEGRQNDTAVSMVEKSYQAMHQPQLSEIWQNEDGLREEFVPAPANPSCHRPLAPHCAEVVDEIINTFRFASSPLPLKHEESSNHTQRNAFESLSSTVSANQGIVAPWDVTLSASSIRILE